MPQWKADGLLLAAAAIWGFAFVAQRVGMEHLGPFTYNGLRFFLGALVLFPFLLVFGNKQTRAKPHWLIGLFLFAGSAFQQVGLVYTTAGKAGFITGLYVIFVPMLLLLRGHKLDKKFWIGAVLATAGLFLLCRPEPGALLIGDGLVLLSAVFWAVHVLLIAAYAKENPLHVAFGQYLVCSLLSLVVAWIGEPFSLQRTAAAAWPLLYGGVCSVGLAYTLQVVAQTKAHPAHAAIILSLEAVFALLGGWLLLREHLPLAALMGCLLMLAAMIISRWPAKKAYSAVRGRFT